MSEVVGMRGRRLPLLALGRGGTKSMIRGGSKPNSLVKTQLSRPPAARKNVRNRKRQCCDRSCWQKTGTRPGDAGLRAYATRFLAALMTSGRPTRRMARSCAAESSGMSEKSILREAVVSLSFPAARPTRAADDADERGISLPPLSVGDGQQPILARLCNPQEARLHGRMPKIRASSPSGSANAPTASPNETPCLSRFAAAFLASHSNTFSA